MKLKPYLQLLRVHQWIKNTFIFIPAFFAGKITDPIVLKEAFTGFITFSILASSVYVLNDYKDIEQDKLHPKKKNRPFASGAISKKAGLVYFILLFLVFLALSFLLPFRASLLMYTYLVMNLAYTFKLKHIAIIDITIIALGFLIRILLGGATANIYISHWLVIIIFLLSMILALGKRRGEFIISTSGTVTRNSLQGYNLEFIDVTLVMMTAITIVSYIMYCVSPEVTARLGSNNVYVTTLFVILGLMRYLQQTLVFNKTESPVKLIYSDIFIQVVMLLWIASFVYFIYGKQFVHF